MPSPSPSRDDLRNVAIVAHVDHGKTTLVDGLLAQAGFFRDGRPTRECFLDSGDLERERGITILAKLVTFRTRGVKINLLDTPGHADFGGEVERVLRMADGVLLLVDAAEGPLPQTRFVLRQAFAHGLRPVVVINKIDRADARPLAVLDEVFDLFVECEASDAQLDFPYLFASGRRRFAALQPPAGPLPEQGDLGPVFDALLAHVPPPRAAPDEPLQFQVATIDADPYLGRFGIGRVYAGRLREREEVTVLLPGRPPVTAVLRDLFQFDGLERVRVAAVEAGDLAMVAGLEGLALGATICRPEALRPLPVITAERPTLAMTFGVNTSPVAGREGRFFTSRHLDERLAREAARDVALRVEPTDHAEVLRVAGRGLLHLGILIETMRREGYEFEVGRPEVVTERRDGVLYEPIERAVVEVPPAQASKVMELFGARRAELARVDAAGGLQRLEFRLGARALLGLRTRLLNATGGEATLHHTFDGYEPWRGELPGRSHGVMVSLVAGPTAAYGLDGLQPRGVLFVGPQEAVYPGMIVGEHCRDDDLEVNPCKQKHLTNIRAAGKDRALLLAPPRRMSIEECLEYLADDELLEVTPKGWRLRKRLLTPADRARARRRARQEA